jgi:glutamate dehydrogenase
MKTLKEIAARSVLSEKQLERLEKIILGQGPYTKEAVRQELDWFCAGLGMNAYYFRTTPLPTIANHIRAVKAAEIIATIKEEKVVQVDLATEHAREAIYLIDDYHPRGLELERHIEEKYPNCRLQSYRTARKALGAEHLRMYVVCLPAFPVAHAAPGETDLNKIADKTFLKTAPPETVARYQALITKTRTWESPLIDVTECEPGDEVRITVVTKRDSSHRFFSNVSDVINSHGLVSNRKYIEPFSNGRTAYSFYLKGIKDRSLVQDLVEDMSLIYVIPESPLSGLFRDGKLTAQETVFGVSAWSFCHQFLTAYNYEYLRLADALKDSPELLGVLRSLKIKLVKDTYTEQRVWDAFMENPVCLKKLFRLFDRKFSPSSSSRDIKKELEELRKEIVRDVPVEIDRDILLAAALFIETILKTNFYTKEKTSLSYMYNPAFLNKVDYPETPFGIFHIVGAEFRGFHVRFRDIARGGVRIVRSNQLQTYLNNSDFIFDENYNLASTQQRKNKDIPEGGSKGTILINWGHMHRSEEAFKKYVDGLLDLMLNVGGVIDFSGQEVLLFLGPDEGTAELMEWAALRARARGYRYWRSFSTGKPVSMGGIPHDLYGMTTNSIHQYVLKALDRLGLKEENVTKVMTGGPDGDLGSNEILISKDRTLAIIDGSGVLYDPDGIDRRELTRLARERKMVEHFHRERLSKRGFFVGLKERDITLPDGEKVESGLDFRNTFHLHPKFAADLFVPCGGRPSSVNINNWQNYIDEKGTPRFKVIVEGANLFLTQQARLRLEEKGVILYKDASANKGGVTSSSLEVLASLALTDAEYERLMCIKNGGPTPFRKKYVSQILEIIRENARLEFDAIWKENETRKIPRAVLSDLISEKIIQIKDAVGKSELVNDRALFRQATECCIPRVLVDEVGLARIIQRVPNAYLKALFASELASRYVYRYGLDANEVNFYEFLELARGRRPGKVQVTK